MWNRQYEAGNDGLTATGNKGSLVPVIFARDPEEAGRFADLLGAMDIPSLLGSDLGEGCNCSLQDGMPVLVSGDYHDRACEILATEAAATEDDKSLDDDKPDDDEDFDDDDDDDDDDFDDDDDGEDFDPDKAGEDVDLDHNLDDDDHADDGP